jgi:hypothetical protein
LRIVVTARNADAIYYSIDIEYDGLWWPGTEIRQHLQVSPPHALPQE